MVSKASAPEVYLAVSDEDPPGTLEVKDGVPVAQLAPAPEQAGAIKVIGLAFEAVTLAITIVQWISNQNWSNQQASLQNPFCRFESDLTDKLL